MPRDPDPAANLAVAGAGVWTVPRWILEAIAAVGLGALFVAVWVIL